MEAAEIKEALAKGDYTIRDECACDCNLMWCIDETKPGYALELLDMEDGSACLSARILEVCGTDIATYTDGELRVNDGISREDIPKTVWSELRSYTPVNIIHKQNAQDALVGFLERYDYKLWQDSELSMFVLSNLEDGTFDRKWQTGVAEAYMDRYINDRSNLRYRAEMEVNMYGGMNLGDD
jgi:hypothetical protein